MHPARSALFGTLGLLLLVMLWQWAFIRGGPFVMPAPADAFHRVFKLILSGDVWQPAAITTAHALTGFVVGGAVGLMFGVISGLNDDLAAMLGTISTVTLGIPPIIWIVLALFWFGPQGIVPAFTVAIGVMPIVFAGALAGMKSSSPELDELATAFYAPKRQRFIEIKMPQISIALLPALATALGFAWKIALMAEVLDAGSGIGGAIANARANLDTVDTMAWVIIALSLLLASDFILAKATRSSPLSH